MAFRVYHASVLHRESPPLDVNGRGERTYTTRPALRPPTASETVRPSAESVADVTGSVSSSSFGPP
jgi:hypothetical protein